MRGRQTFLKSIRDAAVLFGVCDMEGLHSVSRLEVCIIGCFGISHVSEPTQIEC